MPGEYPLDPALLDLMGAGPAQAASIPWLVDAVELLPRKHREVIEAIFYERLSKVDLAERLGVHRTVVDRLLGEALEAMRVHIEMGPVQTAGRKRLRPVSVPRKPRNPRDEAD
jgi:hypothetical protein